MDGLLAYEPRVFRFDISGIPRRARWHADLHEFHWGTWSESHDPTTNDPCLLEMRANCELGETTPSQAEWEAFWTILDLINVWDWKADYNMGRIKGGGPWVLRIEYGHRKLESRGNFAGEKPPCLELFVRSLDAMIRRNRIGNLASNGPILDDLSELLELATHQANSKE